MGQRSVDQVLVLSQRGFPTVVIIRVKKARVFGKLVHRRANRLSSKSVGIEEHPHFAFDAGNFSADQARATHSGLGLLLCFHEGHKCNRRRHPATSIPRRQL